jgi:hypothetical protein
MNDEPLLDTRNPQTMTLRDQFAMAAMQIAKEFMISEDGWDGWAAIAEHAYHLADAMMRERAK